MLVYEIVEEINQTLCMCMRFDAEDFMNLVIDVNGTNDTIFFRNLENSKYSININKNVYRLLIIISFSGIAHSFLKTMENIPILPIIQFQFITFECMIDTRYSSFLKNGE